MYTAIWRERTGYGVWGVKVFALPVRADTLDVTPAVRGLAAHERCRAGRRPTLGAV